MKIQILVLLLCLLSCNGQDNNNKPNKNNMQSTEINLNLIKNFIADQANVETEENDPENPYDLSEKDFKIAKDITVIGLKNSGYKIIPDDDYNKKLLDIFGIKKGNKCANVFFAGNDITLFGNAMDGTLDTKIKNQYEFFSNTQNFFIVNNEKFLTQMFLVKDLVIIKDNSYSIQIPQFIIARNKYLFNDSKGDLTWLLVNDKEFLKKLVVSYGYDKENQINKMVLEDFYKEFSSEIPFNNISKLGEFIFVKDCEGTLKIRDGLLKYVSENTTKDDDRFIYALGNYLDFLFKIDNNNIFYEQPSTKFTIEEKAKIVAYVANIESPNFYKFKPMNSDKAWSNAGTSLYNITSAHPEILRIIEKNNYYGLFPLKEVIESVQFEEETPNSIEL